MPGVSEPSRLQPQSYWSEKVNSLGKAAQIQFQVRLNSQVSHEAESRRINMQSCLRHQVRIWTFPALQCTHKTIWGWTWPRDMEASGDWAKPLSFPLS